jgi:hypothetical protein
MAKALALTCLAALFSTTILHAQTATGTILGTVTDPSGARIAGATLEVVNQNTGFARKTTSGTTGDYEFVALPAGVYTVRCTVAGFKSFESRDNLLQVEQHARVDAQLVVGEAVETVSISAEAPLVNTDDASLGNVVQQKQIVDLPLNRRNFMEFATLVPGVNEGAPNDFRKFVRGFAITANGARAEFNGYYMDGADNNDEFSFAYNVTPSIDAIEQFKVQTGMFSAEFGRSAGAVVNLITRSGTNQFHGTLFEFLRNDKLDARNFFAGGSPQQPFRQNQYGGSVGGPVIRNKTFFFFNYEGTKIRQAVTSVGTVPTAAQKSGDLSTLGAMFDPNTTRPDPAKPGSYLRDPFPGNRIPQNRIDPISTNVLPYWPDPTTGSAVGNYVQNKSRRTDGDRWLARVDHNLTSKDRLFGRVAFDNAPRFEPGPLPQTGGQDFPDDNKSATVNWTRSISPHVVNEAQFGYNRMRFGYFPQNSGQALAGQLGLKDIATGPPYLLSFPLISVAGFTAPSDRIPFYFINNRYQITESLSWQKGSHSLKFGFEHSRIQTNTIGYGATQGRYTFTNRYCSQPGSGTGGSALCDFLLGDSSLTRVSDQVPLQYFRGRHYSGYVTDEWKVSSRLTLSLGLRYENQRPIFEKYDRMVAYNRAARTLVFPRNAPIGDYFQTVRPDLPITLRDQRADYNPDNNNFAPRLGFALRPFNSNRTSIRGGFGIFYSGWMTDIFENTGTAPPFVIDNRFTGDAVYPDQGWNRRGGGFAKPPPGLYAMSDRNVVNAYIEQWALNVQHMFGPSTVVEIGYVGHHGLKLPGPSERNPAPTASLDPLQARRYDPLYSSILSWESMFNSWHESMTASIEKRYSQGLQFLAAYTWGKTIDDSSTTNEGTFERFPTGPGKFDRGLSSQDMRHRFVASSIYDLPFGRGRPLLASAHGVTGALVTGWRVSGVLTLHSGYPQSVSLSRDNLNNGLTSYPNRIGNGLLPSGSPDGWFDRSAFVIPPFGTQGNSGRNILIGPGFRNLDFSVTKDTAIRENKERIEFRAEFFNLTNHPNFGQPSAVLDTAQFGKIFALAGINRQIQFGLKLYF